MQRALQSGLATQKSQEEVIRVMQLIQANLLGGVAQEHIPDDRQSECTDRQSQEQYVPETIEDLPDEEDITLTGDVQDPRDGFAFPKDDEKSPQRAASSSSPPRGESPDAQG